jgi:hypothetical protein
MVWLQDDFSVPRYDPVAGLDLPSSPAATVVTDMS